MACKLDTIFVEFHILSDTNLINLLPLTLFVKLKLLF